MYMNLFIKGFQNYPETEEQLKTLFQNFGPIKSFRFNPNGTAYVCYHERETARNAMEVVNRTPFNGSFLNVCYYQPKELRELNNEEVIDKR
jgi:RNA recognition motif-containing protein